MNKNDSVKTILILGANPTDTTQVRLGKEIHEIQEALRRSDQRSKYKLEVRLGVSSLYFYRAILDYKPQIIHFCGHGLGEDGIILEDDKGKKVLMETATLATWFQNYAQMGLECVILNACYSEVQAEVISQYVDYVLGMKKAVGDEDAISFSRAFYDALGSGCEVEQAYNLTRCMSGLKQETLVLKKKPSFIERLIKPRDEVNNKQPNENNQLNWDQIPFDIIQTAYRESLPPSLECWELYRVEEIIKYLKKCQRYDQFLIKLSKNKNLSEAICNQLRELAIAEKNQENKKVTQEFLKPYLIVSIKPVNNTKSFLVNAWLVEDDSLPRDSLFDIEFKSLINEDTTQPGLVCNFEKIPEIFKQILEEALDYLLKIEKKYYLTIEFFLPKDLMFTAVEQWKMDDPIINEISLGTKYAIHLRSLERQDIKYLRKYRSPWLEKWNQLRAILDTKEQCVETFYPQKEATFDYKDLKMILDTKIGLKATCALTTDTILNLLNAILLATTPIAIWTRCSLPHLDSEIDNILFTEPLSNLCESIRITREKADIHGEQHLGNHLALLWENPYRLTPDAISKFKIPGQ